MPSQSEALDAPAADAAAAEAAAAAEPEAPAADAQPAEAAAAPEAESNTWDGESAGSPNASSASTSRCVRDVGFVGRIGPVDRRRRVGGRPARPRRPTADHGDEGPEDASLGRPPRARGAGEGARRRARGRRTDHLAEPRTAGSDTAREAVVAGVREEAASHLSGERRQLGARAGGAPRRGRNCERVPATVRELNTLAKGLRVRGAADSEWNAALGLSGRTSFADRVVAVARYNRAVGLGALIKGLEAAKPRADARAPDRLTR